MNFRLLFAFIVVLVFHSCIKEVEISRDTPSPTLVMNAILQPDSSVAIHLSAITPSNSNSSSSLDNATVSLQFNNNILTSSAGVNGWYRFTEGAIPGETYSIEAQLNGFPNASASCQIPIAYPQFQTFYTYGGQNEFNEPVMNIHLVLDDDASSKDFYEVIVLKNDSVNAVNDFNFPRLSEALVLGEGEWSYQPNSFLFTDNTFNGQSHELVFNAYYLVYFDQNNSLATYDQISVEVRKVSEAYFTFRKSWNRHLFNQNSTAHTDDPLTLLFQGDPEQLYSNVNGGLGLVGSFLSRKAIVLGQ